MTFNSTGTERRTWRRANEGRKRKPLASGERTSRSATPRSWGKPRSAPPRRDGRARAKMPSSGTRSPIARSSTTPRSQPREPDASSSDCAPASQGGGALRRRAAPQGLVQNRLRRRQRDDEAGLQQQRIHLEEECPRCSRSRPEPDPRRRAPRRAVEATRQLGCAEPLGSRRPAFRSSRRRRRSVAARKESDRSNSSTTANSASWRGSAWCRGNRE